MFVSTTDNLAQSSPLLFIFDELAIAPHDAVDDFNDFAEAAHGSLDLHESCDGKADLAAVLENHKQLDPERDRLDVQRVNFVNSCSDDVILARVLEVANSVSLPLLEENDKFLTGSASGDAEAEYLNSRLNVEETGEP